MPQTTIAVDQAACSATPGLISGRLIVCLASRWDIDPTSKHHLMRGLSRDNDIVWVNYHASRRPGMNPGDLRSAAEVVRRIARGAQRIGERMVQITPFLVPSRPGPFRDSVNRLLLHAQLRRALKCVRRGPDQPVQLWTFAPDAAFLAGALGEECLVYYCVDEFSEFAGYDRSATLAAEGELIDRANVVFTTSESLYAARSARHPRVHLVRHGVDHAHFAQAVDGNLPLPESLRKIPRPIAGFVGLVREWFDAALMAAVAVRMPDMSFVVVGDHSADIRATQWPANVHFLGRRPYAELPAYLAAFDIGLVPFVRSRMTENVNPIKLREYLAAGLPVVATGLPEVRRYAPDVTCADEAGDFASACRRALVQSSRAKRRERSARMIGESWDVVSERVSRLVAQACVTRDIRS